VRLINFEVSGEARLGVRAGEEVVDLTVASPQMPRTLNALLAAGPDAMGAVSAAAANAPREAFRAITDLKFLPPSQSPSKIICLGVNFREHAVEGDVEVKDLPPLFLRGSTSLVGHGRPIVRPTVSNQLDFEAELAVVIGRRARHVPREQALSVVAGYAAFNDGSIRDYQLRTSQWTLGKNFDGTGGFGPELVTPDEVPPGASGLRLQCRLNGEIMQDANTREMIFGVQDTIAILTQCLTLLPGDLLVMGTCAGVGLLRNPPVFMKPGDVCEVEIEGIGVLSNPIVQEDPTASHLSNLGA
jgi:2-keto-4-pentenoate hydratase/2-oxohepta-3-ene-1,7-dioic acid hydratase in catechol pathway